MSFENEDSEEEPGMFNQNEKTVNEDTITVNIKTVQGDTDYFEVKTTDKIGSLIKKYTEQKKHGNSQVLFNFKGRNLKENETFKEVGIESDDTIHVLIRLRGGVN